MSAFPVTRMASITEASSPSPVLSGIPKPSLPKRSHRRSLVGEMRPQLPLEAPPLPSTPTLHHAPPPPSMTASSSTTAFTSSSNEAARERARPKRASTGTSTFAAHLSHVAPLNIANKKATRSSSRTPASPVVPSSANSPFSARATPTVPAKSKYRKSVDSPGSAVYTPASHPSIMSRSHFVKGIGLDFGSPEPLFLSSSSSLASQMAPSAGSSLAHTSKLASGPASPPPMPRANSNPGALASSVVGDDRSTDSRGEDGLSDTSPSSVATSIPDRSELGVSVHGVSHDGVFSHDRFASFGEDVVETPKRASLFSSVPMAISRSHQELIDGSPRKFHRNEAEGLFDSVRGLMADLRFDIDHTKAADGEAAAFNATEMIKPNVEEQQHDQGDLTSWLTHPERSHDDDAPNRPTESENMETQVDTRTPSINIAAVETTPVVTGSRENTSDTILASTKQPQQQNLALLEPTQPGNTSDGEVGASPRTGTRGLWGLLRAPSPSPSPSPSPKPEVATRSPSVSSYSSTVSFVPQSTSPEQKNASSSSLLSNSSFALFSRKFITRSVSDTHTSSTAQEDDIPVRLSRRQVDEDKLADLIISCADARHILKTDNSPKKLKEVGLKLELGWREQLAEAQQLRSRLEVTQDTVEDLEDENKQLRSQLGSLSEQIVSREDAMKELGDATAVQIQRERHRLEVEMDGLKTAMRLRLARVVRELKEEKAFALGLVLMARENERRMHGFRSMFEVGERGERGERGVGSSAGVNGVESEHGTLDVPSLSVPGSVSPTSRPNSVLFELASDTEEAFASMPNDVPAHLRRSALLQARPSQSDPAEDTLETAYEQLFRCPTHRFAQGPTAPPSTLVDERVLLVGTDERLLVTLAQKLSALGLSQVMLATPVWSTSSPTVVRSRGVHSVLFDADAEDAWGKLAEVARKTLGGEVDCVVNAFDQLDVERLGVVSGLLRQQVSEMSVGRDDGGDARQAVSMVNMLYEDDSDGAVTSMCTMALISLVSTLSIQLSRNQRTARALRLNSILLPNSSSPLNNTIDGIIRLIDPCSTVQGSILQPHPYLRCLGQPLCPALPACFTSPTLSVNSPTPTAQSGLSSWTRKHAERHGWFRFHKRIADMELVDALDGENAALRERVESLERSNALLQQKQPDATL